MLMLLNKLLLLIGRDMSLASGAHKLDFAEQAASCWGSVYVASDTSAPQRFVLYCLTLPYLALPCLALSCIRPFYFFINFTFQNAFCSRGPPGGAAAGAGAPAPPKKKTRRLLQKKKQGNGGVV